MLEKRAERLVAVDGSTVPKTSLFRLFVHMVTTGVEYKLAHTEIWVPFSASLGPIFEISGGTSVLLASEDSQIGVRMRVCLYGQDRTHQSSS